MSFEPLLTLAIDVVVIVVLALLSLGAVRLVSQRILKMTASEEDAHQERQRQLRTLVQVIRWTANGLIIAIAVLMLLGNFVDITPLLASAGVAGLAISLGAQSLIKDFIGGLLILVEGQYTVGDIVKVAGVSGSVERLTLRTTHVRDIDGSLHIVSNGDVRIVSNVTRDWSRALVDIGVAYEEDMDRVIAVLEQVLDAFVADPEFGPQVLERPRLLAPLSLGDWAINVRIMVKTPPGKHWGVAMALRKRILAACEREGIVLPYPRQEVWVHRFESKGD
jgi:small-conductance mechanosensitive channel